MAQKIVGIKSTFAGGEYAPSLQSRVDLQLYQRGAKTLRNFIVHPHGGISNRPGFHYIAEGKTDGKKVRLIEFEFSSQQTYVIEFGEKANGTEGYCRFYTDGGQIMSNSTTPYEITTPYLEDDLDQLSYTQSADILYIAHPDYAPRELVRSADTSWTIGTFDFSAGPFMLENTNSSITLQASATTGNITLSAVGFTFNALHKGALFKLRHYVVGGAATTAFTDVANGTEILCGGTWRIITHGTWTGTIRVEKLLPVIGWVNLREFSSADDYNVDTYGEEDMSDNAPPFSVRVRMTAYTSGTCNVNLTTDGFYRTGVVKITSEVTGSTAQATVTHDLGSVSATEEWAEGSWSNYRGWPAVVEFHPEDRLVFANTESEPDTYWISKSGRYTDFGTSTPLVDSDAISSPLPSRRVNGINGLIPLTELVVLTAANEASVRSSSGPLTPTTAYNRIHGYEGSYGVRPVVIGDRALYVQAIGSYIRDIGLVPYTESFAGSDISILSNHLFTNYAITEMTYQQNPDKLIWCIRDDGVMLALTYMREQEVLAWTWHDTYGGDDEFESVCSIRGDGYDEVWVSVKRGTKRYIERMDQRMASTKPRDQFFVDSGITYDEAQNISGSTWTGTAQQITCATHGYSNGDIISIEDVVGTTEINDRRFKIANKTANTFELTDETTGEAIDGSEYTAYVSGGKCRKAAQIITGLDHLEGRTVAILADGNVLAQQEVAGSSVTLDALYSVVHVGLPYYSDLETLNIEVNLSDGTTQGRKVKVSQIELRFLNSRGGYIGPDSSTLKELGAPYRSVYDDPLSLYSGPQKEHLGGGYTDGGRIFFRQVDPLPVTILAIIPAITIGGISSV